MEIAGQFVDSLVDVMVGVQDVSKTYVTKRRRKVKSGEQLTTVVALHDVNFEIATGQCVTIIGTSGCGKSTLLQCIGGLIPCTSGKIVVSGQQVQGPGEDRAMVFQHPALLPWRDVTRNVSYGLEMQGLCSPEEREERVRLAISTVGLAKFTNFFPHELSGGMQQRVNLARAVAVQPQVLLLDEPFGALDAFTKSTLQSELPRILLAFGCTSVFVTHDIEEAVLLGDRIIVMSQGQIVADVPSEVKSKEGGVNASKPDVGEMIQYLHSLIMTGGLR